MEKEGEHIKYRIEKKTSRAGSFSFVITFLMIKYQTGMQAIHPKKENKRIALIS
jgi:hypothetical protein